VHVAGGVQQHQVGPGSGHQATDVGAVEAAAPPAVAAYVASTGVIPISRTARATQSGIEEV
jgi:hypothetical protein